MSKPIKWHTEKRKLSQLKEFGSNPRDLTEKQYEDLKKSLTKQAGNWIYEGEFASENGIKLIPSERRRGSTDLSAQSLSIKLWA